MRHPQHIQQSSHYTWLVNFIDDILQLLIYGVTLYLWRNLCFCYDVGTHNLLVESNVVYDIMGGAIFIEDGIETGNIIQHNLAVYVRQSTSLLRDDITPGKALLLHSFINIFIKSLPSAK